MVRGFKAFDVYGELHLDRDSAQAALRGVPAALGPDADRAGRELGKKMTDGIAKAVEQSSARVARARRAEQTSAEAVRLAEVRLDEARRKAQPGSSALLAAEQRLEAARRKQADATSAIGQAERALTRDRDRLATSIREAAHAAGPEAERSGQELGGKLSQGIHLSIVRNSPLIMAAASAAMIAGAPLLLAGATTLFAGIGAVAAAQSDDVKSAWLGAWQEIKTGAIDDAAVLVPVYVRMADKIAAGFEEMRPQIRDAFEGSIPLIDSFTDSVVQAAENALPGLVDAIERGQPVIDGLGQFMEHVGTGLSDLFSGLSEHADASGQSLDEVGQAFETILPLLGEFLGQGVELAADVLPSFNRGLSLLLTTAKALGPALPFVITGLSAMSIGKSVAGGLEGLATSLGRVAKSGSGLTGMAGTLSANLAGVASSTGAAGAALGFMAVEAYAWTEAGRQAEEIAIALGRAMEIGGSQAEGAKSMFSQFDTLNRLMSTGIGETVSNIQFLGYSFADLIPDAEQSRQAYDDWYHKLDDVSRAAEDVKVAQEKLRMEVSNHGPASREAAAAADELKGAQDRAAAAAAAEEQAIRGVTDAMLAQTDAVLAASNSEYAHRVAIDSAHDAFLAMNDAVKEHGAWSEEAADSALQFEGALRRVVAAAGQMASDALPAAMSEQDKLQASQLAQLDSLHALADQYGDAMPGALREMMVELERATSGYDRAGLEARELEAGTKNAKSAMEGLGEMNVAPTIDADDKLVRVKTEGAFAQLRILGGQHPMPLLDADDKMMRAKQAGAMAGLARLAAQRPTPPLNANDAPITGVIGKTMGALVNLGRQRPVPVLSASDRATPTVQAVLNKIAAMQSRTVTLTTNVVTTYRTYGSPMVASTLKDGGPILAASGIKVQGPGGPRDDLVPAMGPGGTRYRLSAGEWIVNAMASALNGDQKMRALNEGRAKIIMVDRPHAMSATGSAGDMFPAASATRAGSSVHIAGNVVLQIPGIYDLGSGSDRRRLLTEIREGLLALDREQS